jgi:hypothetical protein
MRPCVPAAIVTAFLILCSWPLRGAEGELTGTVSVLDGLAPEERMMQTKTDQGLKITAKKKGGGGYSITKEKFKVPLIITAQAQTDSTNIRLRFGEKGEIIFNWELDQNQLRHHDPRSGHISGLGGKGGVPKNTWVTIRWIIDKNQSRVEVDGEERGSFKGSFENLAGTIGVGTSSGAVVQFKSLTVSPVESRAAAATAPVAVGPIEITVPSAAPAAGANDPEPPPPPDFNAIDRPEFHAKPKRLVRNITAINAMMVRIAEDGQASGVTSDIIATVPRQSRSAGKAAIGFYRADGDVTMKTAFEEAVRAVQLRYPLWEPGRIDLSFGEKFTAHGGPSAGVAFALLTLSALEGFDIDPKFAVTGDITVDWKVRKVGGVAAKLRGATLDKFLYAAIPDGNEAAFADMAFLHGSSALWEIQVFSISTLQQAIALARTDRPQALAEAIKLFAELQPQLNKNQRTFLRNPQTQKTLKRILELAPNHLSARHLLAIADNTAPKTLSANGTIYQLSVIFYPYRTVISSGQRLDRSALPAHVTALARKRLNTLRPMAHKDLGALVADISAFIEAIDGFAGGSVSGNVVMTKAQSLDARFATLNNDPDFVAKLVREGY